MSSTNGTCLRLSIFGESHGPAIGCVIDGLPAGEAFDLEEIRVQMARRAPGRDATATRRVESDSPRLLSGFLEKDGTARTTGAPLAILIENENQRSGDYRELQILPRPGHADYPGYVRYHGFGDVRGGGHFSGRLTAPLVFAGALCKQLLRRRGVAVGGHIAAIGGVEDRRFDPVAVSAEQLEALSRVPFSLLDPGVEPFMRSAVEAARMAADSVGGIVEAAAVGLPAGLGSPMFDGVENRLASLLSKAWNSATASPSRGCGAARQMTPTGIRPTAALKPPPITTADSLGESPTACPCCCGWRSSRPPRSAFRSGRSTSRPAGTNS